MPTDKDRWILPSFPNWHADSLWYVRLRILRLFDSFQGYRFLLSSQLGCLDFLRTLYDRLNIVVVKMFVLKFFFYFLLLPFIDLESFFRNMEDLVLLLFFFVTLLPLNHC